MNIYNIQTQLSLEVPDFTSGNLFVVSQNQRYIYSPLLFVAVGHWTLDLLSMTLP